MAKTLTKNRIEKDSYTLAFTDRLAAGETITNATVVVEHLLPITGWDDVSVDLVGALSVATGLVTFFLNAATTADVQPAGTYRVLVEVVTDGGRTLVGEAPLMITE